MRNLVIGLVAAIIAAAAGYAAYRYWGPQNTSSLSGQSFPSMAGLTDLEGHPRTIKDWQGQLVLVNFWATWCGPCLKEIPDLAQAQDKYRDRGLQLIGPAVDDPENVKSMVASLKFNYPVLVDPSSDEMIKTMETLSNTVGGLPFSVLVGPDGKIIAEHLGPFTSEQLIALVEPNLPK